MLLNMIAKPAPSGSVKNPLNSSAASVCHTTFPIPTSIAAMFVFTPDAHREVVTSRYFRVHLDPNGPNCGAVVGLCIQGAQGCAETPAPHPGPLPWRGEGISPHPDP